MNCHDTRKRKGPNPSSPRPIYVVVVESHQHVLEHIHTVLRREKLLTKEWRMLHFDAHPDLACPHSKIPAKACFLPHDTFPSGEEENTLYELLDSTATGIAEWILPLVLAANLRQVHWIKPRIEDSNGDEERLPRAPSQLPLGTHEFQVGASFFRDKDKGQVESFMDLPTSAIVKVDWPHPYYLEDDCTAHYGNHDQPESFLFPQPLRLEISEMPLDASTHSAKQQYDNSQTNKDLWALDICLDYFACQNPFLADLQAKDLVFARSLLSAVYESRFYSSSMMNTPTVSAFHRQSETILQLHHYRRDLQIFWRLLVELLKRLSTNQKACEETYEKLQAFYPDPRIGRTLLERLAKAFVASPTHANADTAEKTHDLIAMTEQALPNLVMPHTTASSDSPGEEESDLSSKKRTPSSPSTMEAIRPALKRVQEEIACRHQATAAGENASEYTKLAHPFIITMARSSNDGFTPGHIVNELQDELLRFLHSVYCGCQELPMLQNQTNGARREGCRFQIVLDYGPWEGSVFS